MQAVQSQPTANQRIASMKTDFSAQRRAEQDAREQANVMSSATRFAMTHVDVIDWLDANESTEFAASLGDYLNRKGFLTEGQVAAVRAKLGTAKGAMVAPEISVGRIEAAFATARESGLKKLKMHLDSFLFKPAGETSANAGGIYVTEDGKYLGKVMGGKFLKVRDCTEDQQARIVAAASDPEAAAKAYGQRTGTCCICGRELTAEESIERFIGPICASKYGM